MPSHTSIRIQGSNPMHMVLLADNSGSLEGRPAADVTEAVQNWIYELQQATRGKKEYFKFSLIRFGSLVEIIAGCVNVNDVDAATVIIDGQGGSTNMSDALTAALGVITEHAAPNHCPPFVFLYTDGHPDDAGATLAASKQLKDVSLPCGTPRVVALGFGEANDELLRKIATSPEFYKRVASSQDLMRLLPAIGTPTQKAGGGTVGDFERQISEANI